MTPSVLVIAAHPDDEVLGCGGTIARMAQEALSVHVAFLADGVFSRQAKSALLRRELESRRESAKEACKILGVHSVSFGDFPDNRLDSIALLDITKAVEDLVSIHQPTTVFTHYGADLNIDHQRTNQAVAIACRPQRGHTVKKILSFEIPSSTEWQLTGTERAFAPNWFVDISDTLAAKLAALNAYALEMRDWPHPRSIRAIEHLARWRGAMVGLDAAEAFVLGRRIE